MKYIYTSYSQIELQCYDLFGKPVTSDVTFVLLLLLVSGGGYAISDEWGKPPLPNPEKFVPPKIPLPANIPWLFWRREEGLCSCCWLCWWAVKTKEGCD